MEDQGHSQLPQLHRAILVNLSQLTWSMSKDVFPGPLTAVLGPQGFLPSLPLGPLCHLSHCVRKQSQTVFCLRPTATGADCGPQHAHPVLANQLDTPGEKET